MLKWYKYICVNISRLAKQTVEKDDPVYYSLLVTTAVCFAYIGYIIFHFNILDEIYLNNIKLISLENFPILASFGLLLGGVIITIQYLLFYRKRKFKKIQIEFENKFKGKYMIINILTFIYIIIAIYLMFNPK